MDRFTNRVLKFIRENELVEKGDNVIVGFSGGADSVALLMVLYELKRLLSIKLFAVHVNHGLRGEEALRDEEFCKALCRKYDIPFEAFHEDVRGYMKEQGLTEEEAGRILRYRAFDTIGKKLVEGRAIKAVAHHADDQAETILFNMLRGSGLKGLGGMQPKRDDIIRPLLCIGKKDITEWLSKKGIGYVTDSTNLENDHTRNRIRNIIMPELKASVNEKAAEHIAAAGQKIYEADEFIRSEAADFIRKLNEQEEQSENGVKRIRLGQTKLKEKPQIFRIYVIIEALRLLDIPLKDWGDRHFQDIDKLLFMGKGAHADLPGMAAADNGYRETYITYRGM